MDSGVEAFASLRSSSVPIFGGTVEAVLGLLKQPHIVHCEATRFETTPFEAVLACFIVAISF